jgi:replication fork protection complex subunit Tof1/Swi1
MKILPFTMQSQLNVINQYLDQPFDLDGKKASELLNKKPRRRRRRRAPQSDDEEMVPELKKKKERKKKEQEKYKSADMIEDSDADEETWAEFFEK